MYIAGFVSRAAGLKGRTPPRTGIFARAFWYVFSYVYILDMFSYAIYIYIYTCLVMFLYIYIYIHTYMYMLVYACMGVQGCGV